MKDIKDKPDFEKLASDYALTNYSGTLTSNYIMAVVKYSGTALMEKIWNDYHLPALKRIEELEKLLNSRTHIVDNSTPVKN